MPLNVTAAGPVPVAAPATPSAPAGQDGDGGFADVLARQQAGDAEATTSVTATALAPAAPATGETAPPGVDDVSAATASVVAPTVTPPASPLPAPSAGSALPDPALLAPSAESALPDPVLLAPSAEGASEGEGAVDADTSTPAAAESDEDSTAQDATAASTTLAYQALAAMVAPVRPAVVPTATAASVEEPEPVIRVDGTPAAPSTPANGAAGPAAEPAGAAAGQQLDETDQPGQRLGQQVEQPGRRLGQQAGEPGQRLGQQIEQPGRRLGQPGEPGQRVGQQVEQPAGQPDQLPAGGPDAAAAPLPGATHRRGAAAGQQTSVADPSAPTLPLVAAGAPALTTPDSSVVTAVAAPAADASSSAPPTPTAPVAAPSAQNPAPPVAAATPAAPVATPVLVAQPAHVAAQLSPQLVALAGRSAGTHRLTLEVKPEAIGSVTVVAHIRPEGTRIELVGGSPAARDALQASLDDLRKDLAATGSGASLDISLGSGAASRQGQDRAPHGWFGGRSAGGVDDGERAVDLSPVRLKVAPGRVDVLA